LDTGVNPFIAKVETVLRSTKGILDVKWLDQEIRKRVFDLEEEVRKEGLSGEGKYYNEGVADVLARKYVCVVLNNNEFRHATAPSLFWIAGNVVIGEEMTDAIRLQELARDENVKVLRKNFVLYYDRMKAARGKAPKFVVRSLPFPEIEGVAGIREVLSASPIGSADVYFKERFGWDVKARDLGTILIGFNLARKPSKTNNQ
jgi:hypothetical protein